MAQNYYWSKSKCAFYPVSIKSSYVSAGSFPDDATLVDDSIFEEYGLTTPAAGKMRGVGSDGMPTWVDGPTS